MPAILQTFGETDVNGKQFAFQAIWELCNYLLSLYNSYRNRIPYIYGVKILLRKFVKRL